MSIHQHVVIEGRHPITETMENVTGVWSVEIGNNFSLAQSLPPRTIIKITHVRL